MVDLLEPREQQHAGQSSSERAGLQITASDLRALSTADFARRERAASAVGAPDDSVFDEALRGYVRPLEIERILRGRGAFVSKVLVYSWRPLFFLLRRVRVFRIPFTNVSFITRFDDVQEVLARDDVFRTPFRAKAARLSWTPPFLLDQQYGADYREVKQDVVNHFAAVDVDLHRIVKRSDLERVTRLSWEHAKKILDDHIGARATAEIEVIRALVSRVPTLICRDYYGVTPLARLDEREIREIEDCFITISSFLFSNADEPAPDAEIDDETRHAIQAAVIVRALIREAIDEAWQDRIEGSKRDDVLFRMVMDDTKEPDPGKPGQEKRRFDDARMTSYVFAMMLGHIPTNLMANGNMLEILFDRPDQELECAKEAARAGNDDLLRRYLFEAMRFRPLNPGPWRKANTSFLLGADGKRAKRLKKGRTVWPCTQSAMFDSRRVKKPRRFDPERSPYVYMLYGFGLHRCIGKPIADAQITQAMKALFVRKNLRLMPSGKLKRMSMFPRSMTLTYDAGA